MQLAIKGEMAEVNATTQPSNIYMNDVAERHMRRT